MKSMRCSSNNWCAAKGTFEDSGFKEGHPVCSKRLTNTKVCFVVKGLTSLLGHHKKCCKKSNMLIHLLYWELLDPNVRVGKNSTASNRFLTCLSFPFLSFPSIRSSSYDRFTALSPLWALVASCMAKFYFLSFIKYVRLNPNTRTWSTNWSSRFCIYKLKILSGRCGKDVPLQFVHVTGVIKFFPICRRHRRNFSFLLCLCYVVLIPDSFTVIVSRLGNYFY